MIQVDELSVRVAERHSEFAKLSHSPQSRPLKKRNGSTDSIRLNEPAHVGDLSDRLSQTPGTRQLSQTKETSLMSSAPRQPSMNPNSQPLLQDAQRKRKPRPGSILSGASAKYRSRSMLIVYYDSAIQEAIEALVRHIGSARNNLRKGKTTANFKARMSSLGLSFPSTPSPSQRSSNFTFLSEKPTHPGKDALNVTARPDPVAAFDQADKWLETAQSLCEVAAHEFLRNGDCSAELEGTKIRFEGCLRVAEQEAARLRQEEEDRVPDEDEEDEEGEEEEEEEEEEEQETKFDGLMPPVSHPPRLECSKMSTIEVDDDDDGNSIHIDLSAFRRTRRV